MSKPIDDTFFRNEDEIDPDNAIPVAVPPMDTGAMMGGAVSATEFTGMAPVPILDEDELISYDALLDIDYNGELDDEEYERR